MPELRHSLIKAKENINYVESLWKQLYVEGQDSFFVSWPWVGCWLRELPDDNDVYLFVIESNNEPCLATLLGMKQAKSKYTFSLNKLFVSETGLLMYDDLVVEQNKFVGNASSSTLNYGLSTIFKKLNADQLLIRNAMKPNLDSIIEKLDTSNWYYHTPIRPSYYVKLEKVRSNSGGYLALISSNKRRQIKRSIRLLSNSQKLLISEPKEPHSALILFEELVDLHQKEWNKRKNKGTFSSTFVLRFHRRLIKEHYKLGKIKLYRIYSADNSKTGKTIGIIYGFISGNDFLYYQSGFSYSNDNRCKPGFTCHSLLIEHLAHKGFDKYDFLAGDASYKQSLGTDMYQMSHLELYHRNLKNSLYLFARGAKRYIRKLHSKSASS